MKHTLHGKHAAIWLILKANQIGTPPVLHPRLQRLDNGRREIRHTSDLAIRDHTLPCTGSCVFLQPLHHGRLRGTLGFRPQTLLLLPEFHRRQLGNCSLGHSSLGDPLMTTTGPGVVHLPTGRFLALEAGWLGSHDSLVLGHDIDEVPMKNPQVFAVRARQNTKRKISQAHIKRNQLHYFFVKECL